MFLKIVQPTREQAFKHTSLWGLFSSKNTTSGKCTIKFKSALLLFFLPHSSHNPLLSAHSLTPTLPLFISLSLSPSLHLSPPPYISDKCYMFQVSFLLTACSQDRIWGCLVLLESCAKYKQIFKSLCWECSGGRKESSIFLHSLTHNHVEAHTGFGGSQGTVLTFIPPAIFIS